MAVSDTNLNTLRTSPAFVGRVRMAVINYAVYLKNSGATGNQGNWSAEMLTQPAAVEQWTARMLPYALINVAMGSTTTGDGETLDIVAADSAIRGEVETQISALFPVA
jgi:hypothetical protein